MSRWLARIILLCGLLWLLFAGTLPGLVPAMNPWRFPMLPPPEQYGNILINRTSEANGVEAVGFSHWVHRLRYTCRVCHYELEFEMTANATEITEKENQEGRFCGSCHNGKTAFAHTAENCRKCHSGTLEFGAAKFSALKRLPKTLFGNRIDWVSSMYSHLIQPKQSLNEETYQALSLSEKLDLESRWSGTPPAIFPHEPHILWLDCGNCHPEFFTVKKKGAKHFEMDFILQRQFCRTCHLKVAFPLDDCQRCHPKMKQ